MIRFAGISEEEMSEKIRDLLEAPDPTVALSVCLRAPAAITDRISLPIRMTRKDWSVSMGDGVGT